MVVICVFWQRFNDLCLQNGKSPTAVALEIGIKSSGTVTGWKNGSSPRPGVLAKIAEYFDVPVTYFLEETPADKFVGNFAFWKNYSDRKSVV